MAKIRKGKQPAPEPGWIVRVGERVIVSFDSPQKPRAVELGEVQIAVLLFARLGTGTPYSWPSEDPARWIASRIPGAAHERDTVIRQEHSAQGAVEEAEDVEPEDEPVPEAVAPAAESRETDTQGRLW